MISNTDNHVIAMQGSSAGRQAAGGLPVGSGGSGGSGAATAAADTAAVQRPVPQPGGADSAQRSADRPDHALERDMQAVAEALNRTYSEKQSLQFSVDKDTGSMVIKVTQSGTGEVVRQIPSEEALTMMQKLVARQDSAESTPVLFDRMA